MGKAGKTRRAEMRKKKLAAAKKARKDQYKAWALAGITKKSRRHLKRQQREDTLVKDHKEVNVAAVLARPNFRQVPGWVNRKAEQLRAA